MYKPFLAFFRNSFDKGILLIAAIILALIMSNSELSTIYNGIIHSSIAFSFNEQIFALPSHLIVNDFLMSIFFLVVGIEIKKELISGHLATKAQRILPVICAICGVIMPCIIYITINNNSQSLVGWAIPTATDIAFVIAIMSIFSNRIPQSIKVFVTALAVIDDLIAVVAIAIFYTTDLSTSCLLGILACITILAWMCKKEVLIIKLYFLLGMVLFSLFFFSGVHSTVSGVVLGFCLPLDLGEKVLKSIHKYVTYVIMPIFAFFNAGVSLNDFSSENLLDPVTLGIMLGLLFGKQFGIFGGLYLLIKSKIAKMPDNSTFQDAYVASILCGIGFTMSLFVASLAFHEGSEALIDSKVGILLGSLISCIVGVSLLQLKKRHI